MMRPATLSCSLLLAISLTGTDVLMAQTGAGCTDDSVTSGSPCGSKLVRSGNFTGRLVVLGQNGEILAPINPGKSPDFEITWDSDQAFSFQLPFSDARRAGFLGTETRSGYSVDTTEVY